MTALLPFAIPAAQTALKLGSAAWSAIPSKPERQLTNYYQNELENMQGAAGGMSAGQRQQFIGEAQGQIQSQQQQGEAAIQRGAGADTSGVRQGALAATRKAAMGAGQQAMSNIRGQDMALALQRRLAATQGMGQMAQLAAARRGQAAQNLIGATPTTQDILGANNQGWYGFGQQAGLFDKGSATANMQGEDLFGLKVTPITGASVTNVQ